MPSKPTVTIEVDGMELEVVRGKSLREGLLAAELSPYVGRFQLLNCRGMGVCGSCLVEIYEEKEGWVERRSCQQPCFGPLVVRRKKG